MHILQVYKDYPPVMGGIEQHVRSLAEGLTARGHRVTVLVAAEGGPTTAEEPREGLRVVRAARLATAASTPISPAMLLEARRIHADLVHLHFPFPPGDLAALLAPGRPPLVVTYHSDIVKQKRLLQVYRPLRALTLRRARVIIASSPDYIESSPVLRAHRAKCEVVSPAIDPARSAGASPAEALAMRARLGLAPGEPAVLFVGRMRYYKGVHVLVEAMRDVPGAALLLAGTGPERARLEAQAAAAGLSGRARFLGDVPDSELPALYAAADVFALPSHLRSEAFGLVLGEAMAAGLPVVSTALGTGTSFVNLHGETGVVVPPGDPAALARALRALLASPELRRSYGEAARRRIAERFTARLLMDRTEEVYRRALG